MVGAARSSRSAPDYRVRPGGEVCPFQTAVRSMLLVVADPGAVLPPSLLRPCEAPSDGAWAGVATLHGRMWSITKGDGLSRSAGNSSQGCTFCVVRTQKDQSHPKKERDRMAESKQRRELPPGAAFQMADAQSGHDVGTGAEHR